MKAICLISILFFAIPVSASDLISKVYGTCDEIRNSYNYIKREDIGGTLIYKGYEGSAGIFCDGKAFKSSLIVFQIESKDKAISLFDEIKRSLASKFGEIDSQLTQEHAEIYYLTFAMSEKPGVVGTYVAQKWGDKQNNLEIKLDQVGKLWMVVVSFGQE